MIVAIDLYPDPFQAGISNIFQIDPHAGCCITTHLDRDMIEIGRHITPGGNILPGIAGGPRLSRNAVIEHREVGQHAAHRTFHQRRIHHIGRTPHTAQNGHVPA
ncbi:hypothetical protein [Thiolapillus sp.]